MLEDMRVQLAAKEVDAEYASSMGVIDDAIKRAQACVMEATSRAAHANAWRQPVDAPF